MKRVEPPPIRLSPAPVSHDRRASVVQPAGMKPQAARACGAPQPPQRPASPHAIPVPHAPGRFAFPSPVAAVALQAKLRPVGSHAIQRSVALGSISGGASDLRPKFSLEELRLADKEIIRFMEHYNTFIDLMEKNPNAASNAKILLKKVIEWITPRNKIYPNQGLDQSDAEVWALFCSGPMYPYYAFPTSYGLPSTSPNAAIADGEYCFAILAERRNEVLLCRDGGGKGHTSITKKKPVFYAGKIVFAAGVLVRWDNDTGHYQTEAQDKLQGTVVPVDSFVSPLLPLSKFVRKV
jgi:hypothetical protein